MASEWTETTIGEQATLQRGFDITRAKQESGHIPVVSSGGVTSFHNIAMANGPGVILGRKGAVGSVYYQKNDFWPHDTTLWVKDFHGNHPLFVYYYFLNISRKLSSLDVGSANPTLNRNHVHTIKVNWPPLKEQKAISDLLCSLDDRITLLRETNATLEAIAQALFKSWFIDFAPVRAKAEGREPEGMDEETAALFLGEFDEAEMGEIPRGWKTVPFSEAVQLISGGTPKTSIAEYWGDEIPWFSVVDAPKEGDVFVVDTEKKITKQGLENSPCRLLMEGTTIISARGTVGKIALVGREMAMNQSCYGLMGRDVGTFFTYYAAKNLVNELKARSHGSVFDTITRDTFHSVTITLSPRYIADAFENALTPFMIALKNNVIRVNTLGTLRDTLLPRLMSGKLRLAEAERELESVG